MSIYVMSDIHGQFDVFIRMLKKISFSEKDELILAGDYIDRGPQNKEMLEWAEACRVNVLMLKGNHDVEFAECIRIMDDCGKMLGIDDSSQHETQVLYKTIMIISEFPKAYFDHYKTIEKLINTDLVTLSDLKRWAGMINDMPFVYKRTLNGKKYIIVHAGYCEDSSMSQDETEQFYMYARDEAYTKGGASGTTIIAGHTPTVLRGTPMYTGGEVFRLYDRQRDCTFYDIDCGCGYRDSGTGLNCRLACIRLDDEAVFYV